MIIVRFTSGLGNQMFQYSLYRFLKEKYTNTRILADLTWFSENNDHHGYELERIFGNVDGSDFKIDKAGNLQLFKATGLIPNVYGNRIHDITRASESFEKFRRYPNRILREFTGKRRLPYFIDELGESVAFEELTLDTLNNAKEVALKDYFYTKLTNLDVSKDWYIKGFFIEERYIIGRVAKMKKHFVFPEICEDTNLKYAADIEETNSVSIHVRRGDYLLDTYKGMFETLGKDYYEGAVNYLKMCGDNLKFFVFSDDPEFVREEFKWLHNKEIVVGNSGKRSFRDMQLMSLCKHNIIANSTFSLWGALLNKNAGHITIYPRAYLKNCDSENKRMEGFVRL